MKYKTIGAFKNVQNIPYCKAAVDMKDCFSCRGRYCCKGDCIYRNQHQ